MGRSKNSPASSSAILELLESAPIAAAGAGGLVRGAVVALTGDGQIIVQLGSDTNSRVACDFLQTSAGPHPELGPGDLVLVLPPAAAGQSGVVLGCIARYRAPEAEPKAHVVIEAAESLSLKCGASDIELRKDGKLLIRGQDVVSRASRTQRIKGGSVAIN